MAVTKTVVIEHDKSWKCFGNNARHLAKPVKNKAKSQGGGGSS